MSKKKSVRRTRNVSSLPIDDPVEFPTQFADEAIESLSDFAEVMAASAERGTSDALSFDASSLGLGDAINDLLAAKEALSQMLDFDLPFAGAEAEGTVGRRNIVGLAIGEKSTLGGPTNTQSLKVYVRDKLPQSSLDPEFSIPSEVDGIPTDVEEVGEISAFGHTGFDRPARGGSSISHFKVTAGTLGCLCVSRDNKLCILSNNHVLANSNNATRKQDVIFQPGVADGGDADHERIGVLWDFVPIDFFGPNLVDAAIAWTNSRWVAREHFAFTMDASPVRAAQNMPVRKCGRTTGHTRGMVVGLDASVKVSYGPSKIALFKGQIVVQGVLNTPVFSKPGDSGSLIVKANDGRPVGLLFAGGSSHTFANPIERVITALQLDRLLSG